jgi:hypothetical protein
VTAKIRKLHIADIDQVVIVSIYNKIKLKFERTGAGIVEQQTIRLLATRLNVKYFDLVTVHFVFLSLWETAGLATSYSEHQNYFFRKKGNIESF